MTEHATYKELRRSGSERMVAGVCGGLGRYFDVNPTFYRVGFAVLTLLGGAGLLLYGAAVLVMPDEGHSESILEQSLREHRDRPFRLLGLGIVSIAAIVLLSHARLWPHGDFAWVLLLLAGLALLGSFRQFGRPGPAGPPVAVTPSPTAAAAETAPAVRAAALPAEARPRKRRGSLTLAGLGLLVVQAGIFAALAGWGVEIPWSAALAICAATMGAIVIGAGLLTELRVGFLAFVGVILGLAAILASTIDLHLNDGVGDRTYRPTTSASVQSDYKLGVGNLSVDLSHVSLAPGRTAVAARLGIGELRVIVPRTASVRVTSHVNWGDSDVLGQEENGHDVDDSVVRIVKASTSTLLLDAHVGAGHIEVIRAAA